MAWGDEDEDKKKVEGEETPATDAPAEDAGAAPAGDADPAVPAEGAEPAAPVEEDAAEETPAGGMPPEKKPEDPAV